MGVRKFSGEDEEFREWVAKRPRGYVLNTDSGLSDRDSTRLHRANCFTLEPGFAGGTRQTVDYIKVCSPDPKERARTCELRRSVEKLMPANHYSARLSAMMRTAPPPAQRSCQWRRV